jgi:selenocysteine lyase/cysteine desulfurase
VTRPHDDATERLAFDVDAIRKYFPALSDGTAYFGGPGGSQTPTAVTDAIRDAMLRPLSNRGHATAAEHNAEEIVVQCRHALSDLLNADPDEVIFGRSMTALTFDLPQTMSAQWRPGDEVVVTLTEASPVSMPTLAAPNTSHSAKNFSLTSASIGASLTSQLDPLSEGSLPTVLPEFGVLLPKPF